MSSVILINLKRMATRHSLLATLLLLAACGHKTDLRLPTAEEQAEQTQENKSIQTTRQPVNRSATALPPTPRF